MILVPRILMDIFCLKYLPRNGVATPSQIITAVQEGRWTMLKRSLS